MVISKMFPYIDKKKNFDEPINLFFFFFTFYGSFKSTNLAKFEFPYAFGSGVMVFQKIFFIPKILILETLCSRNTGNDVFALTPSRTSSRLQSG